jgi:hypothetical protein
MNSRFAVYNIGDKVKFLALIFSRSLMEHKDKEGVIIGQGKSAKCCSGGDYYTVEFPDGTKISTIKKNLLIIKEDEK